MQPHMDDNCIVPPLGEQLDKAIYIIKYDDASFREMHKNCCLDNQITVDRLRKSAEIQKFLKEHPEYIEKSINEICIAAGGTKLLTRIVSFQHTMQEKNIKMEAILNKHTSIYPELLPLFDDDDKE